MASRPAPREIAAVLGVLAALLVAAATLRAAVGGEGSGAAGMRLATEGAISISSSKEGQAIFALGNIAPGSGGQGEVTIANRGSAPGSLTLAARDLSDDPGAYGGALSLRLELRLLDLSAGGPSQVYAGQLASMPELDLGTLGAGEERTYRFVVTMLDAGAPSAPWTDDNLYQRGGASLGYEWTLTESEGGGPEEPEPEESGPQPSIAPTAPLAAGVPQTSSPAPPPVPTPLATPRADKLLGTSGNDVIRGLGGADRIVGLGGRDRLYGGPGRDRIYGGSGPDTIFARGGGADFVDCGSGRDRAHVDPRDRVRRCEQTPGSFSRAATANANRVRFPPP